MASKAAEANQPAPPYEETATPPVNSYPHNHSNINNIEQGIGPSPMFISARTCVYGPVPVELDCPHCQAHIVTHIDRIAGVLPWLVFGICVILGFFLCMIPWCFSCVPFFTDQCLDVLHSCPACKRHLGRYSRM